MADRATLPAVRRPLYTAFMNLLRMPDQRTLSLDRPRIMGILNLTPDSFSDGGQWADPDAAVQHALAMADQGADVIDVGGESTRPGSRRVDAEQQKDRVLGVIDRMRRELDRHKPQVVISIDTTLSAVAAAALDAGAAILNDVAAGREDQAMFHLAASRGAPIILMHMRGQPATMQQDPHYDDVVREVKAFLVQRAEAAIAAGVPRQQILIDPGIGFGKRTSNNLALLANLNRFVDTGFAVLLGTSRKRFMAAICQENTGSGHASGISGTSVPLPQEWVGATSATTALGVAAGVAMFRVHDVWTNRQAADVAWAIGGAVGRQT